MQPPLRCCHPAFTLLLPLVPPAPPLPRQVRYFGYPQRLHDLEFDSSYMVRGLVIDKKRGNMLKVRAAAFLFASLSSFPFVIGLARARYARTQACWWFDQHLTQTELKCPCPATTTI